ncbi:hypothetical protein POM88_012176 [Heracleum sosnowskyi]|uniref:protein disulfide-isomerase n=1 Tax=Heracleum sosnowskyi TaxID=360622 RepID=A0AAD8MX60_9APIA|nr:hypothetical protein POM88_012176 [Heracleum sosnowskyi]
MNLDKLFKSLNWLVLLSLRNFQVEALEKFIEESSVPSVTLFNKDLNNHLILVKYFDSRASKDFDAKNTKTLPRKPQYFELTEDQVPVILIQTSDSQKYLKVNVEADQIAPWLKEYTDGKLNPYVKSEPIPQEPVKVVVRFSIQDVFCSSSMHLGADTEKLAPILDEVAISFKNDPDVVIAIFIGLFLVLSREEFDNFTAVAEKLRSDYDLVTL